MHIKTVHLAKAIFFVFFLFSSFLMKAQNEPYKNASLTPTARAEDLVSRLTLEEKVGLMQDVSVAVDRLNIPTYNWWNEALHGVARAGVATVFPQTIGMAASFDTGLITNVYTAVSDEARAKFNDFRSKGQHKRYQGLTFWTPNVNIFRDPRWGRGQETYGEDPYLTGQLGMAVVRALQGPADAKYDKLHACAKHFAVHSGPEWNRHSFDAKNIAPRDLWETYLPAFKNLVVDADVKEIMCAYNRFEGEPCCGSKTLLVDILRNKWGYKGIIVSDCWAINDFYEAKNHATHPDGKSAAADAVISGTDLECGSTYKTLVDAVKSGLIPEEQINISVKRLMKARFELGEMDPPSLVPWSTLNLEVVNSKKHQKLALEAARKSIVLLQNKNSVLPLVKSGLKIAVMGPNANDSIMQRGNYEGIPAKTYTILQGIKMKTDVVTYEKGSNHVGSIVIESAFNKMKTPDGNAIGFTAEYWNTVDMTGPAVATQVVSNAFNFNNGGATVFAPGVNLTNFSSKYKGVFSPGKNGEVVLQITGDDAYRVYINNQKVIEYWGKKKAQSDEYKLMAKKGEKYEITIEYMQSVKEAVLKFDLGYEKPFDPIKTIEKVKDADVVIFVGGISPKLEGEEMRVNFPGFKGGDRTDIELPLVQRELLKALKAAGKKVVFVNCSGSAMGLMPETESCDAIVQAWYPGESGGIAVADVLFGDYNPSGKLPITFYKNVNQLRDFEDYSMNNRTYRFMKEAPLFAFGHGLSYAKFEFEKASLKTKKIKVGNAANLIFSVKNKSAISGDVVTQVYIRNLKDKEGPIKTLRAFKRVALNANETKEVTINLPASSFEFFDNTTSSMKVKPGFYEVLLGSSSVENELKKLTIEIK